MLRILYNTLWYPALPFALMAGGTRGRQDRRERMGKLEISPDDERPRIWIHASSVGEVEAIRSVAHGLLREFEGALVVVTTMTATGRGAAPDPGRGNVRARTAGLPRGGAALRPARAPPPFDHRRNRAVAQLFHRGKTCRRPRGNR